MYNKLNCCNIVKINSYLRHNVIINSKRSIYNGVIDIDDEVYEAIKKNKETMGQNMDNIKASVCSHILQEFDDPF